MSDDNSRRNTLSGGPASDSPLSTWHRPSTPRIGRIGGWNNSPQANRASSSPGRFATLSSLGTSSPGPARPILRDDDDEEGPPREGESWFAGGERSGISVQNPNTREHLPGGGMVQDILRRAAEMSASRPSQPDTTDKPSAAFRGGGHTLGSDEVESTFVPDPDAQQDDDDDVDGDDEEVVQRFITFWRNGFSIEGGGFYSYADPENERLLAEINTGRAPVAALNVRTGQAVEVIVSKRINEDYIVERQPFGGSGNRLGSPVPSVLPTTSMPGSLPTGPSAEGSRTERSRTTTTFQVNHTQPTTTVQIRLADGTRIPCRMNLTHTVGDIRNFINASRPENLSRPYTIGTSFPNRVFENDAETIEQAGLGNSVVLQRWV